MDVWGSVVCLGRLFFTVPSLHPSCSLLSWRHKFWQHSDPPTSCGPPASPLLLSVCLSLFSLLSVCASSSWSGRSGAGVAMATRPFPIAWRIIPGFRCFLSRRPENAHPRRAQLHVDMEGRSPFSSLTLSPLFTRLNCNHNIFPLPCLPPFTPGSRFTWVSQVRKLTLWGSAESEEMSLYGGATVHRVSVGFVTLPPLLEGITVSRDSSWPADIALWHWCLISPFTPESDRHAAWMGGQRWLDPSPGIVWNAENTAEFCTFARRQHLGYSCMC